MGRRFFCKPFIGKGRINRVGLSVVFQNFAGLKDDLVFTGVEGNSPRFQKISDLFVTVAGIRLIITVGINGVNRKFLREFCPGLPGSSIFHTQIRTEGVQAPLHLGQRVMEKRNPPVGLFFKPDENIFVENKYAQNGIAAFQRKGEGRLIMKPEVSTKPTEGYWGFMLHNTF